MKPKLTMLIALMAMSGTALAQDTSGSKNNPSNPQKQDPLMMQGSGPEDWTKAKGHDKGYLTMQDAQPNSWLAQNFKKCDKNNDGKITADEYDKCSKRE